MNLLSVSIFLFAIAVAIGLYLVFLGLRKHTRSPVLGLTHAGLVVAGFIVLSMQIYTGPTDKLNNFAALFLFFALVGGGMVFALREENKPPSMLAVTIHAVMGLIGITALIINLF
jgi:peptidoglycan/LPS O-acetylase OafA/YrhL